MNLFGMIVLRMVKAENNYAYSVENGRGCTWNVCLY